MTTFDVVGFGALNVDRLFKVDRIAEAGQESRVTDRVESAGGSAANTIAALARLKCNTGFIGKLAADEEGKTLLKDFKEQKVDTGGIIIDKNGHTGTAIGFVDQDGQRALYIDPGVNDIITFEEIDRDYVNQSLFLHITSFAGDRTFETQKKMIQTIPESVRVSFDPGIFYARRGLDSLDQIVKKSFVLMPNATELKMLTGETDYCKGAELLLERGAKVVAVKLGDRGCYVTDGIETRRIEAYDVRAVDTTGAGDAFSAGFLYGLVKGKSIHECGRLGNFVASRCITKMGARTGLPTLSDLVKQGLV